MLFACFVSLSSASPYPRDKLHDAGYGYLLARDTCTNPCGADNQYCCEAGQSCTTQNNVASCVWGQVAIDVYTTTWTETHVYTKTISNTYELYTTEIAVAQCVPPDGTGQTACGSVCCGSWQTCAWEGQCLDRSSGLGGTPITTTVSGGIIVTTQYSAPYRPTSISTSTATTTTSTGGTIVGVGAGDDDGLSGGAIAGIVIGVIAGVILLLLLCACCLVKNAASGFMGLFRRKEHNHSREKIVVTEDRYVRHGVGGRRQASVYSDRPSAAAARKKEGGKGLLGMAAGLGTLALLLGLKKHEKDGRPARSTSSYSSTYYTDSYTGSTPSKSLSHRLVFLHACDY